MSLSGHPHWLSLKGVEKRLEVINNALFKQGIGVALAVAAQLVVVLGGIVMPRFLGPWRLSQGGLGTLVFGDFFRTSIVFLLRTSKLNLEARFFMAKIHQFLSDPAVSAVSHLRLFPEALFGGPLFALADIPDDPGLVILAPWMIQETRRWKKPMIDAAERKSCLFSPMCIFRSLSAYHIY